MFPNLIGYEFTLGLSYAWSFVFIANPETKNGVSVARTKVGGRK